MTRFQLRILPYLILLAGLGGCSVMRATQTPTHDRPPPAAGRSAVRESSVLAFVARARTGERATVTDPAFGGTVVIEVEAAYHSASDRDCRRFAVTYSSPSRRETRYACFADGRLRLVTIH